jgi:hypothetical protein
MCYGRVRVYKFNVMKRTQNVTPALLAFRTNQKSGGSGHGLQSPLLIGITRITSRLRCTRKCDCSITTDNWTGSGFALPLVHNVQPIGWSYSRVLPAGQRRICSAACGAWANQCPNHDDGRESRRRSTRPPYPALRFRRRDGSGLPSKLQNDVADFARRAERCWGDIHFRMSIHAPDTDHYCFPFNTRANEIFTESATHSVLFQSPWPAPNSKRLSCAVPTSLADPFEGTN